MIDESLEFGRPGYTSNSHLNSERRISDTSGTAEPISFVTFIPAVSPAVSHVL